MEGCYVFSPPVRLQALDFHLSMDFSQKIFLKLGMCSGVENIVLGVINGNTLISPDINNRLYLMSVLGAYLARHSDVYM